MEVPTTDDAPTADTEANVGAAGVAGGTVLPLRPTRSATDRKPGSARTEGSACRPGSDRTMSRTASRLRWRGPSAAGGGTASGVAAGEGVVAEGAGEGGTGSGAGE
eukprot:CAMPEP_0206033528 /NCGR_PEP_ID=MMETSP1466-20131121/714_1 /ASSEMBLY_ACC=CAM_ASM_001126 /TAXON_ID=44452 /ORGANISM="Pavlova gyrans, Strain CCMP608" /LENGTH=105 /DNA_ID=CAMNT_0053407729 /DNA_START=201 /DNA_END=518 /DNA_ORIENTATION=-